MPAKSFVGQTVERTHSIVLEGETDMVFPLFGPIREADWAAGWEPEMVAGDGLTPQRGAVFRTVDDDRGETVWLLSHLDLEERRIGYVRTTPLSDLAEISIAVDPHPSEGSIATVTYRITSLSEEGNQYAGSFTEERYGELIDEWQTAINHFLATGEQLSTHL